METQNLSGSGGVDNRHVIYTYDGDGNLATLGIPGYTFDYLYTNRNQVKWIDDDASGAHQAYYEYDTRGNVTLRNVYSSPVAVSNYQYDTYDRPTLITHTLNGTSRSLNYGYYANSDNLEFVRRLGSSLGDIGDVFRYDRADQAISFQLNVATPQNVDGGSIPQKAFYDSNGNRTSFTSADTYDLANNLNQYTNRTTNNQTYHAEYDISGNLAASPEGTSMGCTYDAQNRLLSATKNGVTMSFQYDGLNRQVSRTVSGTTTYSTWDGWDLVEEYTNDLNLVIQARYLYGPSGLVKELQNNRYYCQDGSGSTALLADNTADLLEWYRYDLQGAPFFYAPNDTQLSASNYSVRHLFTGQQWYSDIDLYDLRNRFYSPDLGRFLQPDPIGFRGDRSNLYRYCGNSPVTRWDPFGLQVSVPTKMDGSGDPGWYETERVVVDAPFSDNPADHPSFNPTPGFGPLGSPTGGGPGGDGLRGRLVLDGFSQEFHWSSRNNNSNTQQQPPPQNPPQPAVDPSQVIMVDNENSFSPSDWSNRPYTLQWSLAYEGRVINGGSLRGITPREAYARTNQIGFATRARRVPGQTVTYNFVSYSPNGFSYNGWSATGTIVDPWGIQSGSLQTRINVQNQGIIPAGVNLQMGGGLSSYLYSQLPASIQYNGYYYAVPTDY
jgi:RHS repeat-associated protein